MGGDNGLIIRAGLPNIEGRARQFRSTYGDTKDGAITTVEQSSAQPVYGSGGPTYDIIFNAADSNSIYGASDTVQPPSLSLIPQIKY